MIFYASGSRAFHLLYTFENLSYMHIDLLIRMICIYYCYTCSSNIVMLEAFPLSIIHFAA